MHLSRRRYVARPPGESSDMAGNECKAGGVGQAERGGGETCLPACLMVVVFPSLPEDEAGIRGVGGPEPALQGLHAGPRPGASHTARCRRSSPAKNE